MTLTLKTRRCKGRLMTKDEVKQDKPQGTRFKRIKERKRKKEIK